VCSPPTPATWDPAASCLVDANGTAGFQATGDYLIELVTPASPIDNVAMFA
jgi:hypothetical protein